MFTSSENTPVTVGIVSTSTTGDLNLMKLVTSSADTSQFGTGNLVDALKIIVRYGLHAIAIRVATGADATATAANIVGATDDEGLRRLKRVKDVMGRDLCAIIVPKVQNDSVVTQMVDTAVETKSLAIAEWLGTSAALITARGTATGYGLKSKNLAIVYGQPQNANESVVAESAGAHLAGLIGQQQKYYNFGVAPNFKKLLGVTSMLPAMTATERTNLNLQGIVVPMTLLVDQFVFRGSRNALYPQSTNQETYLMRMLVEQVISTSVDAILAQRVGENTNLTAAYTLEAELSAFLSSYPAMKAVSKAYAKFNESLSDLTLGSLVYDVCVTMIGLSGVSSFVFQVVT